MKKSLVFLFRYIWREKILFLLGLILTSAVSTLAWYGPRVIERMIDEGFLMNRPDIVRALVLVLAFVELGRLLSVFLSQLVYAKLGQNVIETVRKEMVDHLLTLPISFFDRVTSGGMMTRVVNDVNSLTDFFQSGFVSVLGNFTSIIAIFLGLFSLHFRLGAYLLLAFLPTVYLCTRFSVELRTVYEETRNRLSELNSKLADFLFGMKTVRALGIGPRKSVELVKQVDAYGNSQMRMVRTFALFHPTLSFGIGVLLLILISYGVPLIGSGELKIGQWAQALSYVVLLQQPLMEISDRWNFFLGGLTSVNRIQEVFQETSETLNSLEPVPFQRLAFENVSFSYANDRNYSLKDVTLEIKKGDWIGIYGESGSGKSTFLQMLYGFYSPSLGDIKWSSQVYSELNLQKLRSYFGVVEQFPFLFSGTVRENLTLFGRFELKSDELRAKFQDFRLISSLLGSLDLDVKERGQNLSMGQKQMMTFLRAYLSKPSIWILDEATAFFDAHAESEVFRALEEQRIEGITVIQVAHKAGALKAMNRIIQVHQGQLQELYSQTDSR